MRSGTTALHEALGAHPDIFMSSVKEPAFFADPDELATDSRVASQAGFAGNRDAYLTLFATAGNAAYRGESSTHYTKQPRITGVAERMAADVPDARILYLIRDPVRRTLSHYRYHVRVKYERKACLEALQTEPIYCATSDYVRQISPFLERFGAHQVRILVLEELVADPADRLAELFVWLGLDPETGPASLQQRNEVAGDVVRARGPEALHRLGRSSRYQRLAVSVLPSGLRAGVRRLLTTAVVPDESEDPQVLAYLRTVHTPHVAAVEQLLGRPMSRWTTIAAVD